jgi:ornithine decarboxylase
MIPSRIDTALQLWRTHLPQVAPYYAVKCNPDPVFLKYLYDKGVQFDCASKREILEVKNFAKDFAKSNIIYANPCKSKNDLEAAADAGSPTTVVDSVEEVFKLKDCGYSGSTYIRLAVDDSKSLMPFSSKFGAKPAVVESISKTARLYSINIKGFSFHIGSGGSSSSAYSDAIEMCKNLLPKLRMYGHRPSHIDIGGGFLPDVEDFVKKAASINKSIAHLNKDYLQVIAEPGRFFATNSFDFYVKVIGKKYSADKKEFYYTIDDSLYGQFSSILFDHAKPLWTRVSDDPTPRQRVRGILFGRTCDSLDVIAKSADMEELNVDDWLCFPNMGAYTRATASEFNGFPRPEVIVTDSMQPDLTKGPTQVSYATPVKGLLA